MSNQISFLRLEPETGTVYKISWSKEKDAAGRRKKTKEPVTPNQVEMLRLYSDPYNELMLEGEAREIVPLQIIDKLEEMIAKKKGGSNATN